MELPELNRRIKDVIDYKADGNVKKFSEVVNISQQKVNRLFNIDTRTGKYPTVPSDLLTCITELFVDIDLKWLLTGNGFMLSDNEIRIPVSGPAPEMVEKLMDMLDRKDQKIIEMAKEIGELKNEVSILKKQGKQPVNYLHAAEP
jgi:hypothetical protein